MPRPPLALRFAGLLSVAVLALHELRYEIGFGGHSEQALAARGHGYLSIASVLAILLLALAAAQLLVVLGRARRTGEAENAGPGLAATWLVATGSLLAIFLGQELVEAVMTPGHPGLSHIVADGGAMALPLALLLGGAVALLMRGAAAAVERAAAGARAPHRRPLLAPVIGPPPSFLPAPRSSLIALSMAGRAPPASLRR